MSAQESERRLVLRELHDELGPCLFGIQAETASIRQSLRERGSGELVAARTRSIDALADTIQQINRRILHTVKPAALTERGLAAALRHLVDRWQETYPKITWSLDLSETDLEGLTAVADLAIYRMVQEGLTNVARHALCTEAGVTISKVTEEDAAALEIVVSDNGQGFDPRIGFGSGLQSMQERIRKLGGDFSLDGTNGGGVALKAVLRLANIS